jgi:hypothetical protein
VLIACDGLEPGHTATTIRVENGRRRVASEARGAVTVRLVVVRDLEAARRAMR